MARAEQDDRSNIEDIWQWHGVPRSMGCNHGGGVVLLHFWLRDTVGPPDHIEPTGAVLDFGSNRPDIRVRLHFATGVRWIRKPSVH